jgi:flagellar motor protein MotB
MASNGTAEGRAKNRRVTIIVVSPGAESDAEKPG